MSRNFDYWCFTKVRSKIWLTYATSLGKIFSEGRSKKYNFYKILEPIMYTFHGAKNSLVLFFPTSKIHLFFFFLSSKVILCFPMFYDVWNKHLVIFEGVCRCAHPKTGYLKMKYRTVHYGTVPRQINVALR